METLTPEGSEGLVLLTIRQFHSLQESEQGRKLHDISKPVTLKEGESYYLGYVPVIWDNELVFSVEDADDWREVDIVGTMSEAEALTALRAVYGDYAELDDSERRLAAPPSERGV